MASTARNHYLDSYLAPLGDWLAQPDVTDIYLNRPGEIWIERIAEPPRAVAVPHLTREAILRLIRQIAAVAAQGIDRDHPILSASLPGGERVQAVIAPATRGEPAVAIRKNVSSGLRLEAYRKASCGESTKVLHSEQRQPLADCADKVDLLRQAVQQRRNILVSGGTSSGKTTLVNALLHEIPADERLVLIEDTPELELRHRNSIGLVVARSPYAEAAVTADDLLIATLRMRPDRIILGEMRGNEAVTFLRAINTGHPGSISTIHADSPRRAIDQLALLVLQSGTRLGWDDVTRYVRQSIDVIVQLGRAGGARGITDLMVLDEPAT